MTEFASVPSEGNQLPCGPTNAGSTEKELRIGVIHVNRRELTASKPWAFGLHLFEV
jgi:hypothetical protein